MLGCDLLLMLGTDFPYRQFYPTEAKIVQIDIQPEKLGNRVPLTMGLAGDIKTTIAPAPAAGQKDWRGPSSTRQSVIIRQRARSWMAWP